jgi:hypothetical protein
MCSRPAPGRGDGVAMFFKPIAAPIKKVPMSHLPNSIATSDRHQETP